MRAAPLLLLAAAAGCSAVYRGPTMYEGTRKKTSEVALVRLDGYPDYDDAQSTISDCWLVKFNGKPADGKPDRFEVLPGDVAIVVKWRWSRAPWRMRSDLRADAWNGEEGESEFGFRAIAGRTYLLDWNIANGPAPERLRRID